MNLLFKSVVVIAPESSYHNTSVDIHIHNGKIKSIGRGIYISEEVEVIAIEGLHVSLGWFDSSVCFFDPGFPERETLEKGLLVAAQSGFTAVASQPNTQPFTDNSQVVSYLKYIAPHTATALFPTACLTLSQKGKVLSELYDMHQKGVTSFGDYKSPIADSNLLKLALQYTQSFNGLVQSYPQDDQIALNGLANEGESATRLGLKGIPALAEQLRISRDLSILEYTGGKLHIPTISTEKSVALIAQAKAKGLDVTCSVSVNHLLLDDTLLVDYNTDLKVLPPLRTKNDIIALLKGLEDGIIDMITSDHCPVDIEAKNTEFANADFGSIGLETAFSALVGVLSIEVIIEKFTAGWQRFATPQYVKPTFNQGALANLTFFNPSQTYTFTKEHILSSSKNAALLDRTFQGKVYGVCANNQWVVNPNYEK